MAKVKLTRLSTVGLALVATPLRRVAPAQTIELASARQRNFSYVVCWEFKFQFTP